MKFLDKTKMPEIEVELTLEQIQTLIKAEAGRDLAFGNNALLNARNGLFKLIRFPSPIGFAVAANCDIPTGTILCGYGGEYIKDSKNLKNPKSAYILYADETNTSCFDAGEFGDLGALFIDLPNAVFLESMGIKEDDLPTIQTSNIVTVESKEGRRFITTQAISENELIGFSYGEGYWRMMRASPVLFHKNTLDTINLSTLKFNGKAVVHDDTTMSLTDINLFGCIGSYCQALLLMTQVLNKAINTTDNNNPSWRRYADHAQKFGLTFTLNSNDAGKEIVLFEPTVGLHVTLSKEICKKVIENTLVSTEQGDTRLTQLFNFFPALQVRHLGCEAPPGSTFVNQQTVLPK